MLSKKLQIEYLSLDKLKDCNRQLRTLPKSQLKKTNRIIKELDMVLPVLIDKDGTIIAGQHFVAAARELSIKTIPVVCLDHLDEGQVRILRVFHDRILEEAEWDKKALAEEFQELIVLIPDLDLTMTAFDLEEIDLILDILPDDDPDDSGPGPQGGPAITQPGDRFLLGDHRLGCGNSLEKATFDGLMQGEQADACFVDMPFNVKVDGHVGNSGKIKHREFAMASGEMSVDEFTSFLTTAHQRIVDYTKPGSVIYSCMDWRHLMEILTACQSVGLVQLNLCAWVKDNGSMGSFYRSRHELVLVFKNGTAKHINNVMLGKHGRNRTNVWEYPGVNSFGNGRMDELKMHPTVKPTAMVADAIKDSSHRGNIILDPFGGSGTTLIAAEKTGRKARLIELDPIYCDVTIRRWQALTGLDAVHAETGKTFNEIEKNEGEDNE